MQAAVQIELNGPERAKRFVNAGFHPQNPLDGRVHVDELWTDHIRSRLDLFDRHDKLRETLGDALRKSHESERVWNRTGNRTAVLLNPWSVMAGRRFWVVAGGGFSYPISVGLRSAIARHLSADGAAVLLAEAAKGSIWQGLGATVGAHVMATTKDGVLILGRRSPKLAAFPATWDRLQARVSR